MRCAVALLVLLTGVVFGSAGAEATSRVALVIGNGAYTGAAALANPVRDAEAIAETLKRLDFDVILATDVDRIGAISAIDRFSKAINGANIALFFYAGHGIQIGGQSFLLPTDVSVDSERALRYSAIDIQEVVSEMERRADASIAILDACRDNPFLAALTRGIGASRSTTIARGLGLMRLSGRGALIAYAAASGDVAADGGGGHSPFTSALLAEIGTPQVEVGLVFRRVTRRVIEETGGGQRPELLVRLVDEVYLNPGKLASAEPAAPATPSTPFAPEGGHPQREIPPTNVFGSRVLRPPAWAEGIVLPQPGAWRSLAAEPGPEAAGNDTYGGAQPLPLAAAVDATILPRGDADWYSVEVPSAGELAVDAATAPPQLDVYARVWNADHAVVADWQGAKGAGGALSGRYAIPAPGRYWIEVTDGNNDAESTEPFRIGVDFIPASDPFEPDNTSGVASPLPFGSEVKPVIYPRGDADWYKVWVPEPGLLSVGATGVPPALGIAMRVWDLNGRVVRDWALPPRPGGDTLLEAELAEPGVYFIETVDGSNDAAATEPFRLAVNLKPVPDKLEPDNTFGQSAAVAPTSVNQVAIFPRTDADWLSLDVDHPGELTLSATGLPESIDLYMRVWTADKQVLRDWFGPPRIGGDVAGFADLPTAGRYFVEVTDGNNDASSTTLFPVSVAFRPEPDQYEPNNGPGEATPLAPGGKILFNILPRSDTDWFRIDAASAGELAVVLDESPPNLDLYFRVWDDDKRVVRDWVAPYRKGGVAEGFADLPRAGTYFIEVTDGNNDERSIEPATLSTMFTPTADAAANNTFGQAAALALDTPVEANILPLGDADWYLLEAPRPGAFKLVIDNVDPALDVVARLWDGEARAGNWYGPPRPGGVTEAEIAVPAAGVYRLEVTDGNNDARSKNAYRIEVGFH